MFSGNEILTRIILSFLFGILIGWERETHGRVAGLRTHVLVCMGANLFMLVSQHMFFLYRNVAAVDPSRIAAQIITGIGFIGAGTIMQAKFSVRGLTTAASLWVVAGIGMAIGSGCYFAAFITEALVLFTLLLLWRLEHFFQRDWYKTIYISGVGDGEQLEKIKQVLKESDGKIQNCIIEKEKITKKIKIEINVKFRKVKFDKNLVDELINIEGVEKIRWE
ncbi:MgtC/SapB family protein [bacterium]|nr:MgtC/SapB family protein [bacterium]